MSSPLIEQLQRQAEHEPDTYRSLVLLGIAELSAKLDAEKDWIDSLQTNAEKIHQAMQERTDLIWQEVYGNGEGSLTERTRRMEFYWRIIFWIFTPLLGSVSIGLLAFLWALLSGMIIISRIP